MSVTYLDGSEIATITSQLPNPTTYNVQLTQGLSDNAWHQYTTTGHTGAIVVDGIGRTIQVGSIDNWRTIITDGTGIYNNRVIPIADRQEEIDKLNKEIAELKDKLKPKPAEPIINERRIDLDL